MNHSIKNANVTMVFQFLSNLFKSVSYNTIKVHKRGDK